MNLYYEKLKFFLELVASYFPSKLPDSVKTHEDWAGSILKLGGYPDNDSFRNAIATQLLHLNTDTHYASKQHFIRTIRRGIVNQVAWSMTAMCKEKTSGPEKTTKEVV